MVKKDIRLQYSGFLIFATKMLSVATGLIFQALIAEATLPNKREYDMWFNVNDILAYFTLMAGAFPFWTMRFMVREKEGSAKTGITSNLMISVMATAIYLSLLPSIMAQLGIEADYSLLYIVASIQIVELYMISMLEGCLQARIPHAIGYGLIFQQVFKVILGYILIVQFQQRVLGAVWATTIALSIQTAFYFKLTAEEMKGKIRWDYVKEWIKGSVVSIYNVVGNQIAAYIFIMVFGIPGARGIYGAALIVANVITYSSFLAYAMYPKLLAEKKGEDITTSLKMVLMFAIPMTAGAMVLSDSFMLLVTGDTSLRDAASVLIVLAFDSFVLSISSFFSSVLLGFETVDDRAKVSLKELAKSRLFVAFSLPYLHAAITLPTTFYVLTNYAQNMPFQAALYVSIINSSARVIMFTILYAIVRKMAKIEIPWENVSKYVLASAVMAAFLFVVPHPTRRPSIVAVTVLGGIIYLVMLIALDKEVRTLSAGVWQEVKNRIKRKA